MSNATTPNGATAQPVQPQPGRLQQMLRAKLGMPEPRPEETNDERLAAIARKLAASLDVPVRQVQDAVASRMAREMQRTLDAVDAAKTAGAAVATAQAAHEDALVTARLHVAATLGEDFPK